MSGEGVIPAAEPMDNARELLDAALPAIRAAVARTLPDADPEWIRRLAAGYFDAGPVMVAAIAGWAVGAGVRV
ncbi:hypothetical protein SAMN06295912_108136 [Sphingomonas laterariae]|uniref:Uncharacterized protein n=1 Tax=Edaphosphingomonas laterariae TaxID=861865 RepID=A0A239F9B3_9SPHN|nr:hypothetical protein [Sphingomonas laterariae]SNS53640.1 hypothetical protein SAMN06295912_108136 [Sphingomonas laterariae]